MMYVWTIHEHLNGEYSVSDNSYMFSSDTVFTDIRLFLVLSALHSAIFQEHPLVWKLAAYIHQFLQRSRRAAESQSLVESDGGALLDSMVVNFVTKFPRGVVWYWYWNWNWFWIWFLKIYADGPLQKVFLSISTDIHDGQFQGREWKSSWCTSYGQVICDWHTCWIQLGPKKVTK